MNSIVNQTCDVIYDGMSGLIVKYLKAGVLRLSWNYKVFLIASPTPLVHWFSALDTDNFWSCPPVFCIIKLPRGKPSVVRENGKTKGN